MRPVRCDFTIEHWPSSPASRSLRWVYLSFGRKSEGERGGIV